MASLQTQIAALKSAIYSGVLIVRHGDTQTTFRSMAEMKEALQMLEAEAASQAEPPRRTVAGFSRGL